MRGGSFVVQDAASAGTRNMDAAPKNPILGSRLLGLPLTPATVHAPLRCCKILFKLYGPPSVPCAEILWQTRPGIQHARTDRIIPIGTEINNALP